jgi:hypothetical protein
VKEFEQTLSDSQEQLEGSFRSRGLFFELMIHIQPTQHRLEDESEKELSHMHLRLEDEKRLLAIRQKARIQKVKELEQALSESQGQLHSMAGSIQLDLLHEAVAQEAHSTPIEPTGNVQREQRTLMDEKSMVDEFQAQQDVHVDLSLDLEKSVSPQLSLRQELDKCLQDLEISRGKEAGNANGS